jgi:aquaporin Z
MEHSIQKKLTAEFLGTFLLVFGGAGTAVFAADDVGILGVALAFGLTVLVGVYAFGPISGGHFNPAVSVGLAAAGRFAWKDLPAYAAAQLVGAIAAAGTILVIASGRDGFERVPGVAGNFASNGFGDLSPAGYSLWAVLIAETLLTAVFLFVILGATAKRAPAGFAGLAIGLCLTLIHLISIPISNTSVNPARSIGIGIFAGGDAMMQLWAFILAPVLGALIAGIVHSTLLSEND